MTARKLFSICTLVSDLTEYDRLRGDMRAMEFDGPEYEYRMLDNTSGNSICAFTAVRQFLGESSGTYALIVHQDARPLEPAELLVRRLQELTKAEPRWGVAGNVGMTRDMQAVMSIRAAGQDHRLGVPHHRVATLDENVLIVRQGLGLTVSADLSGFHFYGFDLCSVADLLGYSSHVIDYLWQHDSLGNVDADFYRAQDAVERKMAKFRKVDFSDLVGVACSQSLA
jgi:hypothetical protein